MPHLPNLHTLGMLLILVFSLASPVSATQHECDDLARQNVVAAEQVTALAASNQAFSAILAGRLPDDSSTITRVLAPIGVERSVAETRALLKTQLKQARSAPVDFSGMVSALPCDELVQSWLSNKAQLAQVQLRNLELRKQLLEREPTSLRVLFRALKAWQQVVEVDVDIRAASSELEAVDAASLAPHLQALLAWQEQFRSVLDDWLSQKTVALPEVAVANAQWRKALQLPRVGGVTQWPQFELSFGDRAALWRETLMASRSELVMAMSHWRNDSIWAGGWMQFARSLAEPALFIDQLVTEVLAAPTNIWDQVSAPFIREFRYYKRQDAIGTLITQWSLHVVGLLLVFWLTIKLAESIPRWIAQAQQASLSKLEHTALTRLISGLFWFVKPNAPWIVVLLLTQAVAGYAKPFSILSWVGPIGALYALFRATRIVFEWLLSRTYSRAGSFISPVTAKQIVLDCQQFAWAIFACGLVWWLGIGTGGGYLRFVIALVTLLIAWWALQWLLFRHGSAVKDFLNSFSWLKREAKQNEDPGPLRRLVRAINAPLYFAVAHLIDGIRSLNQQLLNFDSYRAFSVKLLRARLESKTEESEADEAEPDENYRDWMTRAASTEMVLEVGEPERVLEPLKNWHKDKTDENVVMLVGDAGSGKTTFIDRLPDWWQETEVDFIRFDSKTLGAQQVFDCLAEALHQKEIKDVGELVTIDAELEPRVIVIDDAHNLFLAEVGCFDAYKALLQCMNAQLNNIFWVVAMHAPSWAYLSCVFYREQRISNVYRMGRWSPAEIRRLILSRHHGSKRRLRYNELLLSASASSESSSVRSADSRVFNILWEQSGGNPCTAIELWLNAAKVKGRVIEMGVPQRPDSAPLKSLKNDLYFVFAAIVVHRRLSTQEIMQATHFAEPIVRHALKQGINLGLIVREDDGRYALDAYWAATLMAFLHGKNLLWSA